MAIKNFLFLAGASFLITHCSTVERSGSNRPIRQTQNQPVYPTGANNPGASVPATGSGNSTGANPPPHMGQNVLPVGVFFGPGAMRAYAHLGVLRVFQRAQIPIVAVGGSEWGSVIAASYAQSKKANEVEWQMLKLQKDSLPSVTLLRRQLAPRDSEALAPFLKTVFADKVVDGSALSFRCPYTDGDQTLFVSRGLLREQLPKCLAVPPLYTLINSDGKKWFSGAVNPGDWAGELRKAGAQFIIYVDVISKGNFLTMPDKYASPGETKALWSAIKALSVQQHAFAHATIEIPMDLDLSDYDSRRNAIINGEQATQTYLDTTMRAIGMAN